MGITNFFKFVQKYSPSAIKIKNIKDFSNKIIGIDANLMIYKLILAIRKNGYDIKNDYTIVTHIHGLLLKFRKFEKHNITPIFVFDGKMPKIKKEEIIKRKINFEKLSEKFKNAKTDDEKKKYYFAKNIISEEELNECEYLINIFGYQVIHAKGEADAELAHLSKRKQIDYIASDDSDILIFGGENILKNFSTSDNKKIIEISRDIILKENEFTSKNLIQLGILLGSDYCDCGVAINKALKIIKNIDGVDNNCKDKCELAFNYFKDPGITKNIVINKKNKTNIGDLEEFLKIKNYSKLKINEIINKIKN